MARVSTVINQVKTSIVETREREEVREAEKNLEYIVTCIRAISLRTCHVKNLSVLSSVTVRFMTITRGVRKQLKIIYVQVYLALQTIVLSLVMVNLNCH